MRQLAMFLFITTLTINGFSKDILVFRKGSSEYVEVAKSLKAELKGYNLIEMEFDQNFKYSEFLSKIKEVRPSFLILMDNLSVRYGQYYFKHDNQRSGPQKALALMGLNFSSLLKADKHISAIAYELPAFTLFRSFQKVSELKYKNPIVFYRLSVHEEMVEAAKKQLALAHITLNAVNVEDETGNVISNLDEKVKSLLASGSYDSVWILLDSVLLTPDLFSKLWVPAANSFSIPFLCGARQLANPNLNFCSFATSPDLTDMAYQASQMVESLIAPEEPAEKMRVETIISVKKVLNKRKCDSLNIKLKGEFNDIEVVE